MAKTISKPVKEIISVSREEALQHGAGEISSGHLLLALLKQVDEETLSLILGSGNTVMDLLAGLNRLLPSKSVLPRNPVSLALTPDAEKTIRIATDIADGSVRPVHLLRAILNQQDNPYGDYLKQKGIFPAQTLKPGAGAENGSRKQKSIHVKGMFWQIFLFEIKYRLKRPDSYLYFLGFFLVIFLAFANGAVPSNNQVHVNAPIVLAKFYTIFSLFMMVVTAAIMGVPLYRDLEYNTHEYYLSYPITKNDYFWGRFLGSFLFVLIIGSTLLWGSMLGIYFGPKFGWIDLSRTGPFHVINYLRPFLIFVIPNLLLTSSIFFGLVAHTKNIKVIYSGGVILYLGYMMSLFAIHNLTNRNIAFFADAFGFTPIPLNEFRYSREQLNTIQFPPLEGLFLVNRILWTGIGLFILFLTWWRFSFVRFFGNRANRKKEETHNTGNSEQRKKIPGVVTSFAGNYSRRMIYTLAKIEWLSIVRDNYFRVILGVGVFFLGFILWMGFDRQFNVPDLPRTVVFVDIYMHNFLFFVFIILLFYTGEALHREKVTKFAIINDALPPADWVLYGSKLAALFFLSFVVASLPVITGILVQLAKGYTSFNLPAYFIACYGITLPVFFEMVMLCFFVHVLINNKFAGHAVGISVWAGMAFLSGTGRFDYRLLLYSYTPDLWITDMDGVGPSFLPQALFNGYWICAGILLVILGALFYARGILAGLRERILLARHRFNRTHRVATLVFVTCFLVLGAYNYYQVSYLHRYLTRSERDSRAIAFEKKLKQYEDRPLPSVTRLKLFMDIYPEERKIITEAKAIIVNPNQVPITEILLDGDQLAEYDIRLNGKPMPYTQPLVYPWPKFTFFKKGMDTSMYRVYAFPQPLGPGDSAVIDIHSVYDNSGFTNNLSGAAVQHNGTAFNAYLPELGYDEDEEAGDYAIRKKFGLRPKKEEELPLPDDEEGRNRIWSSTFSTTTEFEATVSTSADQLAIAPGVLDKEWREKNRHYFHYVLNNPATYIPYPVLSARYSVMHDSVEIPGAAPIDLDFYYSPAQSANLPRFLQAYKDGIRYYARHVGPYPFKTMRLIEGPAVLNAGGFANSLVYGEGSYWNADFRSPDQFDFCYFFTAYRLGYQWWKFQVTSNHTQGAQVIGEGLSKYGAFMVYEKMVGKNNMRFILNNESNYYMMMHQYGYRKENPLLYANRDYVWDTKAGVILYGLKDLIGEDSLNAALQEFYQVYAFRQHAPFPGGNDLYAVLKKHVPDSLQYYLTDSWEKITVYDNKILNTKITPSANKDEYKVHLEVEVNKYYADSSGNEKPAPIVNDYLDIGIFAADSKDKEGRTVKNPLYLQKHRFTAGKHILDILVKGKPERAGIDPYGKLIDKNTNDN